MEQPKARNWPLITAFALSFFHFATDYILDSKPFDYLLYALIFNTVIYFAIFFLIRTVYRAIRRFTLNTIAKRDYAEFLKKSQTPPSPK